MVCTIFGIDGIYTFESMLSGLKTIEDKIQQPCVHQQFALYPHPISSISFFMALLPIISVRN